MLYLIIYLIISLKFYTEEKYYLFKRLLLQSVDHIDEWNVEDKNQRLKLKKSKEEIYLLIKWYSTKKNLTDPFLWKRILSFVEENFSLETQEMIVSIFLEMYGEIIDELENYMNTSEELKLDPSMSINKLKNIIEIHFDWALKINFNDPEKQRRFWYYSEEKLEPRFGDRYNEPGAEKEMPLAIARDISDLYNKICNLKENISVSIFLQSHPEYRATIKRVQTLVNYPYAEIRDNLIDSEVCPLDLLRFKLAFFGASKFDPKSDLWTRITLFQGAPLPNQFANNESDEWPFPTCPD